MYHTLMLIPTAAGVGLYSVADGLVRAIHRQGLRVSLFKPVYQRQNEPSAEEMKLSIPIERLEAGLSQGRKKDLLEEIVAHAEELKKEAEILVVQGLIHSADYPYAPEMNEAIAKALSAEIILVSAPTAHKSLFELFKRIEMSARDYAEQVVGCIINKIDAPDQVGQQKEIDQYFLNSSLKLLASIPWQGELTAPRVKDVCTFLKADLISEGDLEGRRITHMTLCARSLPNLIGALKPGALIITAGDRVDIVIAVAMAALSGIKVAGLVLTGGYIPDPPILTLCERALKEGLPILSVKTDSFRTTTQLQSMPPAIPSDDKWRLEAVKNFFASQIDSAWIQTLSNIPGKRLMSPIAFRYQLIEKARQVKKRIVLPEGTEPRTLAAAAFCAERGIAHCVLLGDPALVRQVAHNNGITLKENLEILPPESIAPNYVSTLVELRKHKGMNEVLAKEQLADPVVVGTMMLQVGQVDGLVSGAMHTTADTIRPALQIIKTAPGIKLVSSIFFMCMPDQVLVYGDCAVNPDPDAEGLAEIAIQSAESARLFGITPRIALLSYSTGSSGSGADVDKVRQATALVKQKRPDLLVDGPLQYDAALIESVAKTKAPNSPVAGQATVFIFPDLNTGNTTYKAVQRSANVLCIGPVLQGLNKPVNDLSRGATIEDIIYTIALTAIQAGS